MADLNTDPYNFIYPVSTSGLSDKASLKHDTDRFGRIEMSWNFYFAQHWTFEREDGEPLITINYLRALIDKKIAFLIGEGFTLDVPDPLQALTMPILQKVWDDNGRQRLPFEIVQEGSVAGDCFVMVTVGPPSPEILRFDPLTKYRIIIQKLNSHECDPVFDEETPPDRYGRRLRVFTIRRNLRRLKRGSLSEFEDVTWVMQLTPDEIVTQMGKEPPKRKPNILGEIPVVHIPNKASARTLFGIDDATDLIPLNREVNEKSTDVSDAINYNAHPITVIIGARAKSLSRGPRSIWSGLPTGASVALLTLQGDFTASVSYLERIKKAMHEIAGVPEGSLGQMQPITGTSGDTLHMTYAPLVDERNKKKATYEPGFERINYFVLRYAEVFQELDLPMGLCEKCGGKIAITFMDDPLDVEKAKEEDREVDKIQVRRCYVVDPETFDFMDPEKHKIPVVRQHSFGDEVSEIMLAQAEREHGKANTSYWDPAPETDAAHTIPPPEPSIDPTTGVVIEPDIPEQPQLPDGFELPPEPEVLDLPLVEVVYDDEIEGIKDKDGNPLRIVVQYARSGIKAVPLDCDEHSFLSPYTNYVTFNDTLPKDRAAQANLFTQYDAMKIVSKAWMMKEIGIENVPAMQDEIAAEAATDQATAGNAAKDVGKPLKPSKAKQILEPGVIRQSKSPLVGVPRPLLGRRPGHPAFGPTKGSN